MKITSVEVAVASFAGSEDGFLYVLDASGATDRAARVTYGLTSATDPVTLTLGAELDGSSATAGPR